MFGEPIAMDKLPEDSVVLRPHWAYMVRRTGERRSRLCCDESPRACPKLRAAVSTWSSCTELPIQRLFLAISASKDLRLYAADVKDAYSHAPKPEIDTYLSIDSTYAEWYKGKHGRPIDQRLVLPINNRLQGHPEAGKMWMRHIDKILVKELGFQSTTHDRCIFRNPDRFGSEVYLLKQVDDILVSAID